MFQPVLHSLDMHSLDWNNRFSACQLYFSSLCSHFSIFFTFQVINYSLVVEGVPNMVDHFGLPDSESVSCRSIFQCISLARETNLAVFVYFHFRNVACRNIPLYQCIDWKNDFKKLEDGTFHLLYVTHKFPVPHKVFSDCILYIIAVSKAAQVIFICVVTWETKKCKKTNK
jgi:hypothetical protein